MLGNGVKPSGAPNSALATAHTYVTVTRSHSQIQKLDRWCSLVMLAIITKIFTFPEEKTFDFCIFCCCFLWLVCTINTVCYYSLFINYLKILYSWGDCEKCDMFYTFSFTWNLKGPMRTTCYFIAWTLYSGDRLIFCLFSARTYTTTKKKKYWPINKIISSL